jgi:hypothetical protein
MTRTQYGPGSALAGTAVLTDVAVKAEMGRKKLCSLSWRSIWTRG